MRNVTGDVCILRRNRSSGAAMATGTGLSATGKGDLNVVVLIRTV